MNIESDKNILLIGNKLPNFNVEYNTIDLDRSIINFNKINYNILIFNNVNSKKIIKILEYYYHNNLVVYLINIEKNLLNIIETKFIFKKFIDNLTILSN